MFSYQHLDNSKAHLYDSTSGWSARSNVLHGTLRLRGLTQFETGRRGYRGGQFEKPMHNLAAEKNIFRPLAASAAPAHARPQPRLCKRLPPNPSHQTSKGSALINVLAGSRIDTPARDHTVHRTPKNSAFITVLVLSEVDTQIRSRIYHIIHQTRKNSAFLNVLAASRIDPENSTWNPRCFVTRTLPATLIPSR